MINPEYQPPDRFSLIETKGTFESISLILNGEIAVFPLTIQNVNYQIFADKEAATKKLKPVLCIFNDNNLVDTITGTILIAKLNNSRLLLPLLQEDFLRVKNYFLYNPYVLYVTEQHRAFTHTYHKH